MSAKRVEILESALRLLERRGRWIRGTEGRVMKGDDRGLEIEHEEEHEGFYDTNVMGYCSVGAIYAAAGPDAEMLAIEHALRRREATWTERRLVAEQLRRAKEAVQRQTKSWGPAPGHRHRDRGTGQ